MQVGILGSAGVELVDRPAPIAGPGEILVELAACGICGTDLEKVRGNYRSAGILGHEPVGRIAVLGAGVEGFSVGDRVFVHHHVPCYECAVCRRGEFTYCPSYGRSNIDPGGFSEKFRVPEPNVRRGAVLRLDESISWEMGSLLEPAGCALTALRRVGFRPGDTVFLVGLGPVGLLYGALARSLGARWVGGADLSERRRRAAKALGFDVAVDPRSSATAHEAVRDATGSLGVDLSVVAVGAPAAAALALQLPRRGGTVNLFGLPERGSRLEHDLQELYLRGVRVLPTYATTDREIADVHQLAASGRLPVDQLVSDRFPLHQVVEAFERAAHPEESLKVVVTGASFS